MKKYILSLLVTLACNHAAHSITMTFEGGYESGGVSYNQTCGTEFTVGSQALQVFRIWDYANTRGSSDTVGIWDTSGTLLASMVFTASDFNSLNIAKYLGGSYLAAPLILNPYTTYILGAGGTTYIDRTIRWGGATLTASDQGNYYTLVGANKGAEQFTFAYPNKPYLSGEAWTSTYFEFNAIPEPSTYALFGLGAIGMLMVMRRKKTA